MGQCHCGCLFDFLLFIAKSLVIGLSHLQDLSHLVVTNFTVCAYNHRLYNVKVDMT